MARRRTTIRVVYCSPANRSGSMKPINLRIAEELGVREQQVAAAISLVGPLSLRASVSKENSTLRSSRRSTRRTARHGWRISICRIARNGGRRLNSRAKRVLSRWQRRFLPGPIKTQSSWLAGTSHRIRGR
jgi:hypothetical protein